MKKLSTIIAIALIAISFMNISAFAQDKLIKGALQVDAVTKLDKNGNEYTRLIVPEQREVDSVSYKTGVVIMAFGEHSTQVRGLKKGDTVRVVAASNEYRGRTSYNIIKVLK